MTAAIQTPSNEVVELEDGELRRIISLAREALNAKRQLNLQLTPVEVVLWDRILFSKRLRF